MKKHGQTKYRTIKQNAKWNNGGKGSISRHLQMKTDGRRNGPKWQRQYHYHNKYTAIVAEWQKKKLKYYEMSEREKTNTVEHWIKE